MTSYETRFDSVAVYLALYQSDRVPPSFCLMSAESKQTSPLYIPNFTPANYGSFFLAGHFLYPCSKLPEMFSDRIPQGHSVLRALKHY